MRNLILSALILASAFQTAMGQTDGAWTYTVANNQATITGYTGPGGAVSIPSTVNGISVVQLSADIFGFPNTSVTSVIIPNSVTSIGDYAFLSCTGLTSVTIPNSVTSIGYDAFAGCTGLTSVTIPNSVTSIPSYAFEDCTSLASVTIPNSVTSIGDYAFYGCTSLASVNIPTSVTSIGVWAFNQCTPELVSSIICQLASNISQLASNSATNYTAGQQSVIANPNTHNLYTTSQIQNMAVGDLVLTRQVSGGFVLNYDIEQSTDLQTWTPYQALSLPLTGLPTDKAFVRIKAKQ